MLPESTQSTGKQHELKESKVVKIASEQLLKGAQQMIIEHRGVAYYLSTTKQGKLILTK